MEVLSSINYGRCLNYHNVHKNCNLCCCECTNRCDKCCKIINHLDDKHDCGNFYNVVDFHNKKLKQTLFIKEEIKRLNDTKKRFALIESNTIRSMLKSTKER